MPGIGTIVNVAAVICGSLIGILLKKGLSERIQESILKSLGIASMFIGIGCTMAEMLSLNENGKLETNGIMLMIISLAIGTFVGELLRVEERLEGVVRHLINKNPNAKIVVSGEEDSEEIEEIVENLAKEYAYVYIGKAEY